MIEYEDQQLKKGEESKEGRTKDARERRRTVNNRAVRARVLEQQGSK